MTDVAIAGPQLRPQRNVTHKRVEGQIHVIVIKATEMAALLQAMKPVAHRVQIHHDFLGVFGHATRAHGQQQRLYLLRIVGEFVAAAMFVVRQLQPVECRRRRQRRAGYPPLLPQRIGFAASRGQQRIAAQLLVIIDIFVT